MIISCPGRRAVSLWALCLILFIVSLHTTAQTPLSNPTSTPDPQATPTPATTRSKDSLEKKFFSNILADQRSIWTSPFRLNRDDAKWGIPLLISTGALWATDRHTSGSLVTNGDNLSRLRVSRDISQLGAFYTTAGVAAGFYLVGRSTHNPRARETGVLAAEALANSGIMVQALKVASQRQRPPVDNSSGEFFDGGSSFPSGHAISAWSVATVIAEEYGPRQPAVRYGAYALATAVGISRYTGRKHFLSDVLVGSAMGYGIGRYVYHQHHDLSLDLLNEKKTSRVPWKLIPRVSPLYGPRSHVYGALLAWNF